MRGPAICLLVALFGVVAGCGGEAERAPALPGVKLAVQTPGDTATTTDAEVRVAGTVSPGGATVLVDGDEADVSGGRFSATVALEAGANVIDVQAGAPRRPAAMTAVRVTRQVPVEIPDVSDDSPGAAQDRLAALGFDVDTRRGGGLLDELVPGTLGVCGTEPDAGERALPGSRVVIEVRKTC